VAFRQFRRLLVFLGSFFLVQALAAYSPATIRSRRKGMFGLGGRRTAMPKRFLLAGRFEIEALDPATTGWRK
jgi:hypothetical protein